MLRQGMEGLRGVSVVCGCPTTQLILLSYDNVVPAVREGKY